MALQWIALRKKLAKPFRIVLICALAVLLLFVALIATNPPPLSVETPEALLFTDEVKIGRPAYADIVFLELYATNGSENYYIYADTSDHVGILMLNDLSSNIQIQALLEGAELYSSFHLEGIVRDLPGDIAAFLQEDNFYPLTPNIATYLDAGITWQDEVRDFLLISGIFLLFIVVLLLLSCVPFFSLARCKKALEKRNLLVEAVRQFETAETYSVGAAVSRDFVYGLGSGVLLAVDEILWVYMRTRQRYGQAFFDLIVADRKRQYALCTVRKQDQTGIFNEIAAVLADRNENILLGHNKENKAAYKALKK